MIQEPGNLFMYECTYLSIYLFTSNKEKLLRKLTHCIQNMNCSTNTEKQKKNYMLLNTIHTK
jgi:hypothetical protein